jgi:predicted O-linked N-acetylglucosamine transferase (SPINDLY family)
MSHQEALESLKSGDFQKAAVLLEKAAVETGYTSEEVNHAYTLALYRIGDKSRLAEIAYRIGRSLLDSNPALAMDYFQRAIFAGLDEAHIRKIGEIFEGWSSGQSAAREKSDAPIKRVAHVVGCLLPGHAPTQYVKMLCSSLAQEGVESLIFTTEWAASWFFNPEGIAQSQDVGIGAPTFIASVEGDFEERADRIVDAIRASGVQAAFYHASLAEQITARVASRRPAPIQVNVNHGSEMDADLFDGYIHLFHNALERTRVTNRHMEWIPLASDIEERLKASVPATRASLGISEAKSVSSTFGNLSKVAGEEYLTALVEILKRFPDHYHLFAGAGDVKAIRGQLHAANVLSRVRFLGPMGDVAPLLDAIDVYLASFPHSDGQSILEAMGAGKPIVVLGYPSNSHYNSGAELVGIPQLIARNRPGYVEIADRLIRNAAERTTLSSTIKERFRSQFGPDRLGSRYIQFLSEL